MVKEPRVPRLKIYKRQDGRNSDGAVISSCPQPFLHHLLQSDTETPPFNPLKTQESRITAGENPQAAQCGAQHTGLLCKAFRIIISGSGCLWRNKASCAPGPLKRALWTSRKMPTPLFLKWRTERTSREEY